MSEQLTQKQASETAGKNYQEYKTRVEAADINQHEVEWYKQDAKDAQDVIDGILPTPSDSSREKLEQFKQNALENVGKYATLVAANETEGRKALNEGRAFYKANNGALQTAAAAEAELQGVRINVQQAAEAAQQIAVRVPEHAGK
jgi:hypothetical protein